MADQRLMGNAICDDDATKAVAAASTSNYDKAIGHLEKYPNCHIENVACRFNGEDCAIPDLLKGYHMLRGD
jgi:hypothetical protein